MKVTFKRETLAKSLQFVRNAIPRKEIEPILNSLYFKVLENNEVQIVATDYDLMSVARCKAESAEPCGQGLYLGGYTFLGG